jgi:hypothetical protein
MKTLIDSQADSPDVDQDLQGLDRSLKSDKAVREGMVALQSDNGWGDEVSYLLPILLQLSLSLVIA